MAKTRKRHLRRFLWLTLLLLVIGGAGWFYFRRHQSESIIVQTETVQRRDVRETVLANGRIQPVLQVKISPEVSGEITEMPVKEGDEVKKGALLLKIKPDFYEANRNSAEANYKSSVANRELQTANQSRAEAEFKCAEELATAKLVSESAYLDAKTALAVAEAQLKTTVHQVEMASASLARAQEELAKTTIYAPISGTISRLNSQVGERVVGTATMAGTEVMTIADLTAMEARVDIGEMDVVLIEAGQKVELEVDAFRKQKFNGVVAEIANTAKGSGSAGGGNMGGQSQSQDATKFEVKVRVVDKESFRPGMSVTAQIETRSRTNVLTVPIQSVTTRPAKTVGDTNKLSGATNGAVSAAGKPVEVVFVAEGTRATMIPVTRGLNDESHVEISSGLVEGMNVISGPYKAINRELKDGAAIKVGESPIIVP